MKQFLGDYIQWLKAHADPERAEKEKAYHYSDMKHYGVKFGDRGKFLSGNRKKLRELTKAEAIDLVERLWVQPSFEERMLALDILSLQAQQLTPDDMLLVERLMRESGGWALLDNFVLQVMEPMLTNYPETYVYLDRWIDDNDFWVRRSALLSQLLLFRKGEGDVELFFRLAISQFDETWIDEVYADGESRKRARFFVRKAIGWSLRELSKKQPEVVFDFLKQYKQVMSGLSYREGKRKLPSGLSAQL